MPVSGLLTQKPDRPAPQIGETRNFSVEQRPKKDKPDETWNKLKNEGEGFGAAYKVLKCDKTDYVDQHGNLSYSLLVELAEGNAPNASNGRSGTQGSSNDTERQRRIERQHSQEMALRAIAIGGNSQVSKDDVKAWTDWFAADLEAAPPTQPVESGTEQAGTTQPQDDIPFAPSRI